MACRLGSLFLTLLICGSLPALVRAQDGAEGDRNGGPRAGEAREADEAKEREPAGRTGDERTREGADEDPSSQESQESQEAEPEPEVGLRPPELLEYVDAELPEGALGEDERRAPIFAITISAEGEAVEVELLESAGEPFDSLAADAIRRFRFRPARMDGEPIPSRIQYQYIFEWVEEGPAELPPAELIGLVVDTYENRVAGATIRYLGAEGSLEVMSDEEGIFRFEALPAGPYRLEIAAPGFEPLVDEETLEEGETLELTFRLRYQDDEEDEFGEADFSARASVEPPPREITKRTVPKEILTKIPGTRGDPLRAVEILPGVGRPSFGSGALLVRGTAPGDSQVFLEGVPVPLLYHFGGLTSFFQGRLLDDIAFYPGNFSTRYGRKTGGILEVRVRDPEDKKWKGALELSAIDVWALAEGPITEKLSVALAIRRSLIDLILPAILSGTGASISTAPVYYDHQIILTYRPTSRDRIRLMSYGASDAFALTIGDEFAEDPNIQGNASLQQRFYHTVLSWDRDLKRDFKQTLQVSAGPSRPVFSLGDDLLFDARFIEIGIRGEWRGRLSKYFETILGVDTRIIPSTVTYSGPSLRSFEGQGAQSGTLEGSVFLREQGTVYLPSVYAELAGDFDPVRIVAGARFDYFSMIKKGVVDPRLNAFYQVNDKLRLKAGVGIYSQPPSVQEAAPQLGNPNLDVMRSVHVSAGGDYQIDTGIAVGLEGFYKKIWNRPISTENGLPPFFTNEGEGRIYGLELSGRIEPRGRNFFGYLSYTLSRSERLDRDGATYRLFDFDQPHIFTALFSYRFPRNWSLGGTMRLVSGNPSTPIIGAIYDASTDSYIPINGRVNSIRNPLFHRFDVRVEKEWFFKHAQLAFFLDLQNAYYARNQEGLIYNYDYSRSEKLEGLPIIPALGIRGEFK